MRKLIFDTKGNVIALDLGEVVLQVVYNKEEAVKRHDYITFAGELTDPGSFFHWLARHKENIKEKGYGLESPRNLIIRQEAEEYDYRD